MTCAIYGSKIGQTMAYTSIDLTEVLTLATFRSDDVFLLARFNVWYVLCLVFNITVLLIVIYTPWISSLLDLTPLTLRSFATTLAAPAAMLIANEVIKANY